ncbi:MAG: PRC-barrel domain-containing protein [Candidatus Caldarchaeum sp.]|jgi:sporulation protein YlmC with PRC-barrel domain/ribosomal protein S27AE|uniref:PRC-barrel domain-containing protein n=1 Tax=Caldiarchaeum subterraneum TaxID=311458 RepID=A0A7C4I2P5_CALS0|nr:PRC-barrel domain-containing protein [Candidatus Caldarchaeales archaeon]
MSSIPRGKLVGMQVYSPDGSLVGVVQDIELPIGGGDIGLQILSKYNVVEHVPWSMVAAAGDIIILKEKIELKQPETPPVQQFVAQPQVQPQQRGGIISGVASKLPFGRREKNPCPTCGRELTWIEQYQRWYCYNCGKYV